MLGPHVENIISLSPFMISLKNSRSIQIFVIKTQSNYLVYKLFQGIQVKLIEIVDKIVRNACKYIVVA